MIDRGAVPAKDPVWIGGIGVAGAARRLTDVVKVFLKYRAKLDFVPVSRTHRQLGNTGGEPVSGIGDFEPCTVLVAFLGAVGTAGKHVDVRIDMNAAEDRTERATLIGPEYGLCVHTPALARTHDVFDVLGAERRDTADRTRAVDVGRWAAHDFDAADQFRVKEERAVREMAGTLIILPRAIDDHGDTTEILQAADVDRSRRLVAAILHPYAGNVVEETAKGAGLATLNLLQRHHADRRQRVDRALLGPGRNCRNRVERLHRRGSDLRHRVHDRRRGLLRLGLLALRLLLFLLLCGTRDCL